MTVKNDHQQATDYMQILFSILTFSLVTCGLTAQSSYDSLQVPKQIQYQGRVATSTGRAWTGTEGHFVFAIYQGATALWNNWDGTSNPTDPGSISLGGGQALVLPVRSGVFSVRLGDTSVSANRNKEIPASVFVDPSDLDHCVRNGIKLAVWFSPDGSDFTRLSPDVEFTSVPYAMVAGVAESVKSGAITNAMLANTAVANLSGTNTGDHTINVKSYGATGNGVTDDTTNLQLAIAAAKAARLPVYFPRGTYLISDSLTLDWFGATLLGDSNQASAIIVTTSTSKPAISVPGDYNGIRIAGIEIKGPGIATSSSSGIELRGDLAGASSIDAAVFEMLRIRGFQTGFNAVALANSTVSACSFFKQRAAVRCFRQLQLHHVFKLFLHGRYDGRGCGYFDERRAWKFFPFMRFRRTHNH